MTVGLALRANPRAPFLHPPSRYALTRPGVNAAASRLSQAYEKSWDRVAAWQCDPAADYADVADTTQIREVAAAGAGLRPASGRERTPGHESLSNPEWLPCPGLRSLPGRAKRGPAARYPRDPRPVFLVSVFCEDYPSPRPEDPRRRRRPDCNARILRDGVIAQIFELLQTMSYSYRDGSRPGRSPA